MVDFSGPPIAQVHVFIDVSLAEPANGGGPPARAGPPLQGPDAHSQSYSARSRFPVSFSILLSFLTSLSSVLACTVPQGPLLCPAGCALGISEPSQHPEVRSTVQKRSDPAGNIFFGGILDILRSLAPSGLLACQGACSCGPLKCRCCY